MQSRTLDETLVEALYDTALFGGDWRPALQRFRRIMGAAEAAISVWHGEMEMVQTAGGFLSTQAQQDYASYYRTLDPKTRLFSRRASGFLFNDAEYFDNAFVSRDPFYQEFSRPLGSRHTLDMMLQSHDGRQIFLASMRTQAQGAFDRAAMDRFRQVSGHFLRVLGLKEKVDRSQQALKHMQETLDRLSFGVFIVAENRKVVYANRLALDACEHDGPVLCKNGLLAARSAQDDRQFESALAQLATTSGAAQVFRLPRDSKRYWTLSLIALSHAQGSLHSTQGLALVVLADPLAPSTTRSEHLRALYGMTEAEAALALALGSGRTLAVAAEQRGVKPSTARTQLLSILRKTGLNRQADLIRLLMNVTA